MVRLGEFNGFDVKERTLTYYRNKQEHVIGILEDEEDFNGE